MIRLIFVALFVVLFLIIGIPVLGIEWLIGKVSKKTMDYSSLRLVQWAFNMIIKLCLLYTSTLDCRQTITDIAAVNGEASFSFINIRWKNLNSHLSATVNVL